MIPAGLSRFTEQELVNIAILPRAIFAGYATTIFTLMCTQSEAFTTGVKQCSLRQYYPQHSKHAYTAKRDIVVGLFQASAHCVNFRQSFVHK